MRLCPVLAPPPPGSERGEAPSPKTPPAPLVLLCDGDTGTPVPVSRGMATPDPWVPPDADADCPAAMTLLLPGIMRPAELLCSMLRALGGRCALPPGSLPVGLAIMAIAVAVAAAIVALAP